MEIDRFAIMIRSLASGSASRRLVLVSVLGSTASRLDESVSLAKRRKRKRCKKSKKCGQGCCTPDVCYATRAIDEQPQGVPFCCPAELRCLSINNYPDACCYPEEVCDPTWTNSGDFNADGVCYLPCGANKCNSSQGCENGECVQLGTARVPRQRR